jgi:F-type H+-transporting ATPase subunit epsilon
MSQGLPSVFRLKIITPRRLLLDADVEEAQVPSIDGLIGILPGHRPLIVALGTGRLTFRFGKSEDGHEIKGGYAEIQPDRVLVFTEENP